MKRDETKTSWVIGVGLALIAIAVVVSAERATRTWNQAPGGLFAAGAPGVAPFPPEVAATLGLQPIPLPGLEDIQVSFGSWCRDVPGPPVIDEHGNVVPEFTPYPFQICTHFTILCTGEGSEKNCSRFPHAPQ